MGTQRLKKKKKAAVPLGELKMAVKQKTKLVSQVNEMTYSGSYFENIN